MEATKYEVGEMLTLDAALSLYEKGIRSVVTDGIYIQLGPETNE